MRDLAYDIAKYSADVKYKDLPKDVTEVTKKFILDTLATTLGGSTALGCKSVVDQVRDWGGKEESTILVYGGKVISENAAFANSMMAHALDFDDMHGRAIVHANASVIPAALAVAELRGGVSGKDLIVAVTLGIDVMCRLGLGTTEPLTWCLSSTVGSFSAALAAGKILGLDEDKLLNAMGIVYCQCAGNLQGFLDGALTKRMQPGFAARGAVLACLLAQRGITGAKNVFEGKFGYISLYHGGRYDRNRVIEKIGKVFEVSNLSLKMYPCGGQSHPSIEATLNVVRENDIKPDDVIEIVVHTTPNAYNIGGKPFEATGMKQTDAQFSIPYVTAVAIVKKKVFIDDFFEEEIRGNKKVLELAKKVKVIGDQEPADPGWDKGLPISIVEIRTRDNKVYSERVATVKGEPSRPATVEEVADKFRKCSAFSAKPIPKERVDEIIERITTLDAVKDVNEVVNLIT